MVEYNFIFCDNKAGDIGQFSFREISPDGLWVIPTSVVDRVLFVLRDF